MVITAVPQALISITSLNGFLFLKCVVQFTFPSFPSYCYPGYSLIYLNFTFLFLSQIHQEKQTEMEKKHHHIKLVSHGHAHSAQLSSSTLRRTCCNEHTDSEPLLAAPTGPLGCTPKLGFPETSSSQ